MWIFAVCRSLRAPDRGLAIEDRRDGEPPVLAFPFTPYAQARHGVPPRMEWA